MAKATRKSSSRPATRKPAKSGRRVAVLPRDLPKEAAALARKLPFIRLRRIADGVWAGEVNIGERRSREQAAMKRGHAAALKLLARGPWKRIEAGHEGWNGRTDTGGNFASYRATYAHPSGVRIRLYEGTSFSTGTYTWDMCVRTPVQ